MTRNVSVVNVSYKTTIPRGIRQIVNINPYDNIFWSVSKDHKKFIGRVIRMDEDDENDSEKTKEQ